MAADLKAIVLEGPDVPDGLKKGVVHPIPTRLWAIGNLDILNRRLFGLFCSIKCSGHIILKTYELAQVLRDTGISVVSGFQSPMEKECLDFLLRGQQPVVICPARSIQNMRLPLTWQRALHQKRLLIVSPFETRYRRPTAELAEKRNRFVASLASEIFVAHAGPGTKTERLCHELIDAKIGVHVVDVPDNAHLIARGAIPLALEHTAW